MTEATPIYLDHQATTPPDPAVVEAMTPYWHDLYANPHSVEHDFGRGVGAQVEAARGRIAALIGAEPREIVFTSGATEANNLAIKGAARFLKDRRRRIVTVKTEHKCVIESCRRLEIEGFEVVWLGVDRAGYLDLDELAAAVDEQTALVSVMAANNEIGTLQPLAEIGRICAEAGAHFHTDAAQAAGKIPLNVAEMGVALLSLSAHKMYGPKGIGALYVRRRPRVRLEPLFDGGGQERGLRSGTLPAPLCVGFGKAAEIAAEALEAGEPESLRTRARWLLERLAQRCPGVALNGPPIEERLPGNLNLRLPGVAAIELIEAVPELALSTGSACSSAAVEPSYVLRAIGLDDEAAAECLRLGVGRFTTDAEIARAVDLIATAVERLDRPAAIAARSA